MLAETHPIPEILFEKRHRGVRVFSCTTGQSSTLRSCDDTCVISMTAKSTSTKTVLLELLKRLMFTHLDKI